jgi:hypothetical protein
MQAFTLDTGYSRDKKGHIILGGESGKSLNKLSIEILSIASWVIFVFYM